MQVLETNMDNARILKARKKIVDARRQNFPWTTCLALSCVVWGEGG